MLMDDIDIILTMNNANGNHPLSNDNNTPKDVYFEHLFVKQTKN